MTHVLRQLASVQFAHIAPAGFRILAALVETAEHLAVDLMITSGTDSHTPPDPHASGEAYDVSVASLDPARIIGIKNLLEQILGSSFAVLYEVPTLPEDPHLRAVAYLNRAATGSHFHIQRKKGTVYPPVTESA